MDNSESSGYDVIQDAPANLGEMLGFLFGMLAPLFSAGSVKRALEQLGNTEIPNELLDNGALQVALMRKYVSSDYFAGQLGLTGLSSDKIEILQKLTETLLTSSDLVVAAYRGSITTEEYHARMGQQGINESNADIYLSNFTNRLSPSDVIDAEFRNLSAVNGAKDWRDDLREQGWTDDRIQLLHDLSIKIPNLEDLFNFAAWNVDDEAFVARLQLDANMPASFMSETENLGISDGYAKRLWRGHWEVPPLFMLKSLYQTGSIKLTDLKAMLGHLQITPGFIDDIAAAFSKTLSESQVKTMLASGTIQATDVPALIAKMGYNPSDVPLVAKQLIDEVNNPAAAEKTARAAAREQFYGLTVASVLSSYKDGLITKDQATTYMTDLGLPGDIVTFQLSHADYEVEHTQLKDEVEYIRENYVTGAIAETDAVSELSQLGITAIAQQNYLYKWNKEIAKTAKLPTKADLDTMLKDEVITTALYQQQLAALGYADQWVQAFTFVQTKTKPALPFDVTQ